MQDRMSRLNRPSLLEMVQGNSHAYFLNPFTKLGTKHDEVALMFVSNNSLSHATQQK